MVSPSQSAACLLQKAKDKLHDDNWAACLVLLRAFDSASLSTDEERCRRQLQTICHIHKAAAENTWSTLFGIDDRDANVSVAHIRRRYKKLAAIIHPDKCSIVNADEAFKLLTQGADTLQDQLASNTDKEESISNKKRRTSSAKGGSGDNDDDDFDFDFETAAASFPWWDTWDDNDTLYNKDTTSNKHNASEGVDVDVEAADLVALYQMSKQDLQREARQRQDALLDNPVDEHGNRIPLTKLQAALKRARNELNQRVEKERETAANDGGFLK